MNISFNDIELDAIHRRPVQPANNYFESIPKDIFKIILLHLDFLHDVTHLSIVSRRWHAVIKQDARWKTLCIQVFGHVSTHFPLERKGLWRDECLIQRRGYENLCKGGWKATRAKYGPNNYFYCEGATPDVLHLQVPTRNIRGRCLIHRNLIYGISISNNTLMRWSVDFAADGEVISSPLRSNCKILDIHDGLVFIMHTDNELQVLSIDNNEMARTVFKIGGLGPYCNLLSSRKLTVCLADHKLVICDHTTKMFYSFKTETHLNQHKVGILDKAIFIRVGGGKSICRIAPDDSNNWNMSHIEGCNGREAGYIGSDGLYLYVIYNNADYETTSSFQNAVIHQFNSSGKLVRSLNLEHKVFSFGDCQIIDGKFFATSNGGILSINLKTGATRFSGDYKLENRIFQGYRSLPIFNGIICATKLFGIDKDKLNFMTLEADKKQKTQLPIPCKLTKTSITQLFSIF